MPAATNEHHPSLDEIMARFTEFATDNTDGPLSIRYVFTTRAEAVELLFDGDTDSHFSGEFADAAALVMVAAGRIVGHSAHRPAGRPPPRGSMLYQVIDPIDGLPMAWGIANTEPDLPALGDVHTVNS